MHGACAKHCLSISTCKPSQFDFNPCLHNPTGPVCSMCMVDVRFIVAAPSAFAKARGFTGHHVMHAHSNCTCCCQYEQALRWSAGCAEHAVSHNAKLVHKLPF